MNWLTFGAKNRKKNATVATAPGPTDAALTNAPILDPAAQNAAATLAGEMQRKKTARSNALMRPVLGRPLNQVGISKPKALIGRS